MMQNARHSRRWAVVLAAVFVLALVMGAGPGVYLVNFEPTDPDAVRFVFGMPIIYAWTVCWFLVQAAVVTAASVFLWRDDEPSAAHCPLEKGGD